MDVLLAQAVLGAVLLEALAGINHEDAFSGGGVLLVEHQDAGGYAGAVEEVCGQSDDRLQQPGAHQLLADHRLGVAPKQNAVGKDAGAFARAFQRTDDVQQVGIVTLLWWRHAPAETLVTVAATSFAQGQAGRPGFVGERRIGDDVVIGAQLLTIEEPGFHQCSLSAGHDCRSREIVQDHVHARQTRGGHVLFLALQRDVFACFGCHFQQQRTGAARGVVGGGGGD